MSEAEDIKAKKKEYPRNYHRRKYNADPEYREKAISRMNSYMNRRKDDPVTIIKHSRNQYEQLCEKDPQEAKRLLAEMESEEGEDFRELMLDGIPEKKGILKEDVPEVLRVIEMESKQRCPECGGKLSVVETFFPSVSEPNWEFILECESMDCVCGSVKVITTISGTVIEKEECTGKNGYQEYIKLPLE